MKIPTKPLRDAFDRVAWLAQKRAQLPVYNHVKFSHAAGKLSLSASDTVAWATASIETPPLEPCCIPVKSLKTLLHSAAAEIDISFADGRVTLKSGFRATLPTLPVEDFADMPEPAREHCLGINCEDLGAAISAAHWAADPKAITMASDLWMCGVLIKTTPKQIIAAATDGKRVAYFETASIGADSEAIIPCEYAKELSESLAGDNTDYYVNDKHVASVSDGFTLVVRRLEGRFPDIKTLAIDAKVKDIGEICPENFMAELETCASISGDKFGFVNAELNFGPTGATITASGTCSFSSTVPGQFSEHSCHANPLMIIECLRHITHDTAKVASYMDDRSIGFSAGDATYLAALLRYTAPAKE